MIRDNTRSLIRLGSVHGPCVICVLKTSLIYSIVLIMLLEYVVQLFAVPRGSRPRRRRIWVKVVGCTRVRGGGQGLQGSGPGGSRVIRGTAFREGVGVTEK